MNRWTQNLILASVTLMQGLFGWGKAPTPEPAAPVLNFPLNDDQQWFVKETYLLLKPYEDDSDYATRMITKGSLESSISMTMKLEKPDFDWYSGVRLSVGRYLANHDKWDVTFDTTYFYAQEKSSSSPNRSDSALLTPLWIPTFDGGATKGNVSWRLNFFNWDLSLGREYQILKTVVAHPFFGLRAALIYKNYKASYSDRLISIFADQSFNHLFKASDRFWGIGPRLGTDLQLKIRNGWSLLGSLSGALFFGKYDVSEKTLVNFTSFGERSLTHYNSKDDRYSVRANLDTGLGLGWETWFQEKRVRLAPSILLEASCWFDTNQFFLPKAKTTETLPLFATYRRQGNLILMGLSFNLQSDF